MFQRTSALIKTSGIQRNILLGVTTNIDYNRGVLKQEQIMQLINKFGYCRIGCLFVCYRGKLLKLFGLEYSGLTNFLISVIIKLSVS